MSGSHFEKDLTFEDAIKRLEAIVENMEQEALPLEEMANSFQEGMQLARWCQNKIREVEYKVETILAGDADGAPVGEDDCSEPGRISAEEEGRD